MKKCIQLFKNPLTGPCKVVLGLGGFFFLFGRGFLLFVCFLKTRKLCREIWKYCH